MNKQLRGLFSIALGLISIQCTTTRAPEIKTEIFYHGTNSVFGYYVCRGVDLNIGRETLDFNASHAKAFYVTKDHSLAEKWGDSKSKMFGGSTVVLQYSVTSAFRQDFKGKVLSDYDEWAEFVSRSRANANDHSYDFVEGMILKNPGGDGKLVGFGHQLAITSTPLAALFTKNMTGGCESVNEPPQESIFDEDKESYKKIPQSASLEIGEDSSWSLVYRVSDLHMFMAKGPATDPRSVQALHQERLVNIPILKKLGMLPESYPVRWDSKHQYLIKPHIPGRTLGETFTDETFWEPQSQRRAKLLGLIRNLIAHGTFIRDMSPRNLLYSSGKWYLIDSQAISTGYSSEATRSLFAHDKKNSLTALWTGSSGNFVQKKAKILQLVADALTQEPILERKLEATVK